MNAPRPGDTLVYNHTGLVVEVLEVETIPPERTITPDVPRWALTVRLPYAEFIDEHGHPVRLNADEYPDLALQHWPGIGPDDITVVHP